MKKSGEHVRVNFGQTPFVFDIDGMMMASFPISYIDPSHHYQEAFAPSSPVPAALCNVPKALEHSAERTIPDAVEYPELEEFANWAVENYASSNVESSKCPNSFGSSTAC